MTARRRPARREPNVDHSARATARVAPSRRPRCPGPGTPPARHPRASLTMPRSMPMLALRATAATSRPLPRPRLRA